MFVENSFKMIGFYHLQYRYTILDFIQRLCEMQGKKMVKVTFRRPKLVGEE